MPGLDGTGPHGLGPLPGGRRGLCPGAYPTPAGRAAARRAVRPGTVPERFTRIEDALAEVLERLERLEMQQQH